MSVKHPSIYNQIPSKYIIVAGLCISLLSISSAATLIKMAMSFPKVSPLAIAAYRMIFAAVICWSVFPLFRKSSSKPNTKFFSVLLGGVFLALHFAFWISSLKYTSVANSLILVTMNPIFVALGSIFILKEKLTLPVTIGTVISIIGCLIIVVLENGFKGETTQLQLGNIYALIGAVAMSAYMLVGRHRRHSIDLLNYLKWIYSIAAVVLFCMCLLRGVDMLGLSIKAYTIIFVIALIPQIIGHSLINWLLNYLHTSYLAAVILLEPVLGTLIAYIFIGEKQLSFYTLVGGMLVLLGVITLFWDKTSSRQGGTSAQVDTFVVRE